MYLFEGETIKLSAAHYHKLKALYPHIDLTAELEQLDCALMGTKKWWMPMNQMLNYRNKKKAEENKRYQHGTRNRSLEQDLTDTSWAKDISKVTVIKN
jgi:hypothetical protein